MQTKSELTQTERRVIEAIQMGGRLRFGSMKKRERLALLLSLTERGYLDQRCRPTQKGLDNSGPRFW